MSGQKIHYVIVGGSAAGMAAAESIRAYDRQGDILVLSEEPDPPYFRPLIPFLISGQKRAEEMTLQGQGPYRSQNIKVRLNTHAIAMETATQRVRTADGEEIAYDRLLIATGSRPYVPSEIKGTDSEGVFALRKLEDARQAAARAQQATHAVMLGGGLLNLKAAFALLERGLAVTLVVFSPEVLSQLMEPDDAHLIRAALDQAGLQIVTGHSATEIISDAAGVTGVVLDDGSQISCQMVCIGKGVRPNVTWLDGSTVGVNGGVKVDRYTTTNTANVFAAGDVAVTFDPITNLPMVTGLWTNAVEMGRCAGANMAGRPTAYGGTFGILNATQVAQMPFVSMGMVHTKGTDYETHVAAKTDAYRKLVFSAQGDRLVGALFVGDIKGAGLYRSIIREGTPIKTIKKHIIGQTLHYGHLMLKSGIYGLAS